MHLRHEYILYPSKYFIIMNNEKEFKDDLHLLQSLSQYTLLNMRIHHNGFYYRRKIFIIRVKFVLTHLDKEISCAKHFSFIC